MNFLIYFSQLSQILFSFEFFFVIVTSPVHVTSVCYEMLGT